MSVVKSKDDVFTVLIHLGYLSYDWKKSECYIPNKEVEGEMVNAVKSNCWKTAVDALQQSEQLLEVTLLGEEEAVACALDNAHDEHTRILSNNDENSLACVISIAYYYARNDYIIHRPDKAENLPCKNRPIHRQPPACGHQLRCRHQIPFLHHRAVSGLTKLFQFPLFFHQQFLVLCLRFN
jgi:hypothetical protein